MSGQKSILRREFEASLGRSVSDRTWQRVRYECLNITDEADLNRLVEVKIFGYLKRWKPKGKVTAGTVARYGTLMTQLPSGGGHGSDLYDAIKNSIVDSRGNNPADSTIYAWGKRIGVPIYKHRWYSAREIWKWLEFLITNGRYQPIAHYTRKSA